MSVSVSPRPAELPLSGGSPGAVVSVYPLLCAEQRAPRAWFDRPSGTVALLRSLVDRSQNVWIPIQTFLIVHPTAGPVLVDTGFHPVAATNRTEALGPVMGRVSSIRFRAEQAVRRQLADRGVHPSDLAAVILTHLHYDHASGIPDLADAGASGGAVDAPLLLDRREWDAAVHGGWRQGYVHSHLDQPLDWRTVDFRGPLAGAHDDFAATLDLFGDGSVRLLSTPGHSRGHMSLLLRLREREMLLCIDAIYTLGSLTEDLVPLVADDRDVYASSRAQIRRFADRSPDAVIVPGHDPDAWASLDGAY